MEVYRELEEQAARRVEPVSLVKVVRRRAQVPVRRKGQLPQPARVLV